MTNLTSVATHSTAIHQRLTVAKMKGRSKQERQERRKRDRIQRRHDYESHLFTQAFERSARRPEKESSRIPFDQSPQDWLREQDRKLERATQAFFQTPVQERNRFGEGKKASIIHSARSVEPGRVECLVQKFMLRIADLTGVRVDEGRSRSILGWCAGIVESWITRPWREWMGCCSEKLRRSGC